MANRMLFGLDIGSSKITALVGSIGDRIQVEGLSTYYYANTSKSNDFLSVQNGVICNLESVGSKVTQVLNEARISADCSIGEVVCGISSNHLKSVYSTISRDLPNHVVTYEIMQDLISSAKNATLPNSYEALDYEIQEYVLDNENYTLNPMNLTASTITSNINTFIATNNHIANFKKVVRYSGFNLAKLVPSGILSGMSVLNEEEKSIGCCMLDIGSGTTDLVVYENGFIRYLCSIPLGGEAITMDIANVLRISRNLAEDIKINYGGCSYSSNHNKQTEGISITDHRGLNTTISRKLLIDVIIGRVRDILDVVKATLEKEDLSGIINSGMVITGGVSLLPNLDEFARQYFDMPVRIGIPHYAGIFDDVVANARYATALGSLYFANAYLKDELLLPNRRRSSADGGVFSKLRRIFSS